MIAYASTNPRLTQYQQDRNTVVPGLLNPNVRSIAEIDYGLRLHRGSRFARTCNM